MKARLRSRRHGAATVELAILLPLLAFLFVVAVDYARLYYHSVILADSARSGALYGSDRMDKALDTAGIMKAAQLEAGDLSPPPLVTSTTGTDTEGHPYVEVTVGWKFKTISRFPGIPSTFDLKRTVRMRIAPVLPEGA
jgi:Flp pilus assembly protein TadG